jgi:hypothetical protein
MGYLVVVAWIDVGRLNRTHINALTISIVMVCDIPLRFVRCCAINIAQTVCRPAAGVLGRNPVFLKKPGFFCGASGRRQPAVDFESLPTCSQIYGTQQ